MSGSVDARKWNAKWRNWDISDILFFLVEYRVTARRRPETFASCMGTMQSKKVRQENVFFFVLRRIVLTLVTLHVQEDFLNFMKIV